MTERRIVILARTSVAVGALMSLGGSAILVGLGHADIWWSSFAMAASILSVFFGVFVWLVIQGQPRNRLVWVMAVSASSAGLFTALCGTAVLLVADDPSLVEMALKTAVAPVDLPEGVAWIRVISDSTGSLAFLLWLTLGLLLFPDGELPSQRWRWVARTVVAGLILMVVGWAWSARPWNTGLNDSGLLFNLALLVLTPLVVVCLVGLVIRFRGSTGASRQQFKWVVWGASLLVPAVVLSIILGGTRYQGFAYTVFVIAEAMALSAFGVAVGKYRLFDIDVVVNKTVVVGLLGLVLTAIYVVVVVVVGTLVGASAESELGLEVAATALVAIAFGPARRQAQQWANRAVYGRRVAPYDVLARFSHRAAEISDDELPGRIPRLVVDGTGAVSATLWLQSGAAYRAVASWPPQADMPEIPAEDSFEDPAGDYSLPVVHGGEPLGGLSLITVRGEVLPPAEEQLVANLVSGLGLALSNAELTGRLRDQVDRLQASRERILTAADEARRALELDLDSGPQQQLVALKVMLGPTRKQAEKAGATKTAAILAQLEADAGEAIQAVREFSGGVYPPLLEAEGLAVAVAQQTRKAAVPIAVHADGIGRYSREVEAAVYFTILEAVQNTAKYAGASTVTVALRHVEGTLEFEVVDDGAGFDPTTITSRSGLANMADRVDAVGGTWSLQSSPGSGTTVSGTVPVG